MQKRKALGAGHVCDRWIPNRGRDSRHLTGDGGRGGRSVSSQSKNPHTLIAKKTSSNLGKALTTTRRTEHLTDFCCKRLPFTDPIADGPTIQKSNTQALKNGITVESTLDTVRKARRRGLRAPVLFMGYYNPLLSYGEERILQDAKGAGVNGFIVVDLPPEEAVRFRNFCTKGG